MILSSLSVLPAVDDEKAPAAMLLQENVFIESSRPKYLENLHSEAQEGLKMMQQEGKNTLPIYLPGISVPC